MAREILIMDTNDECMRIRTLPNLAQHEFCVQQGENDELFQPTIVRSEQRGDFWEFTIELGSVHGREILNGMPIRYDFPRANADSNSAGYSV